MYFFVNKRPRTDGAVDWLHIAGRRCVAEAFAGKRCLCPTEPAADELSRNKERHTKQMNFRLTARKENGISGRQDKPACQAMSGVPRRESCGKSTKPRPVTACRGTKLIFCFQVR
jgi:hypothetical protein